VVQTEIYIYILGIYLSVVLTLTRVGHVCTGDGAGGAWEEGRGNIYIDIGIRV